MPDVILYAGEASPKDVRLREPSYSSAFYPGVGQLSDCYRNIRINSLYAWEDENLLAGYFPAEQFRWTIPADRMGTGQVYRFDTNRAASHLFASVSFDPAHYGAISQLANSFRNVRNRSLYAENDENLLAGYFPADIFRWTIPADRMARASSIWKTDTHHDLGWLTEDIFAPVQLFDPALFPAIAELVGVRTPMAAQLAVAYYLALYDLGWVHDVIPLTDPVPGAEIVHLRPIAPVMSARRRNKRRR